MTLHSDNPQVEEYLSRGYPDSSSPNGAVGAQKIIMHVSKLRIAGGAAWIAAGYMSTAAIRFTTNVILTHLLAPELFGMMVIVNTIVFGCSLLSDIGTSQNIIYSDKSEDATFRDTAWIIEGLRGLALWFVCCLLAWPVSRFYKSSELVAIFPISALGAVFIGFYSTSIYMMDRRLQWARRNIFEVSLDFLSAVLMVLLVWRWPNIWSLAIGSTFSALLKLIASHCLNPKNSLHFSRENAREIFGFGKYVTASSVIYLITTSFDRMYIAKMEGLTSLGVFGLARSISDMSATVFSRIGTGLIFPLIASSRGMSRPELRERVSHLRLSFTLSVAIGLPLLMTLSDLAVNVIYDKRYNNAAWMLPVLLFSVWPSLLCSTNESTLLGFGKPVYGAVANGSKALYLIVCMPIAYLNFGIAGAILIIASGDVAKYIGLLYGQRREEFSFLRQDALGTAIFLTSLGAFQVLRWCLGYGTSFDQFSLG